MVSAERQVRRAVLFRVDASRAVGFGHLMRGFAVAARLHQSQIGTVFVVTESEEIAVVRRLLLEQGQTAEILPLGVTVSDDAHLTVAIARRQASEVIMTDLCHRAAARSPERMREYHRGLKGAALRVVTFDDGSGIGDASDVVIDPYLRSRRAPPLRHPEGQRRMIGPEYFIFRGEFVEAARVPRVIRPLARRVLLTVGGADPLGITVRVTRALTKLGVPELEVKVVLGAAFAPEIGQEVRALLGEWGGAAECLVQPRDMAGPMLWADVAVTGEGLTKYETAVTGTPSLIVSQFEADRELVNEFEQAGSTWHVGSASMLADEEIGDAIGRLLGDFGWRRAMSQRGKELVDGQGMERVMAAVFQEDRS